MHSVWENAEQRGDVQTFLLANEVVKLQTRPVVSNLFL